MNQFHLTIVSATTVEIQPIIDYLDKNSVKADNYFLIGSVKIDILITGIGILSTTYTLMDYLHGHKPDQWIQAGIGGAVDSSLVIGKVYQIVSELLFDFGAQEKDGTILNPFDLGWYDKNEFPFTSGILMNHLFHEGIPTASGMTSLYAHGNEEKIKTIPNYPHGQVESMEGAAFFYVSLMKKIPFVSLRAISNYVQPRDKSTWQMDLATTSLAQAVIPMMQAPHD